MKKSLIVLSLCAVFAALLFAQDVQKIVNELSAPETSAVPVMVEEMSANTVLVTNPSSAVIELAAEPDGTVVELSNGGAAEAPVSETVSSQEESQTMETSVVVAVETESPVLEIMPVTEPAVEVVEAEVIDQVEPVEEVAAEEEPVQTDEVEIVSEEPATGAELMEGLVSISLRDVELQDVIRLFSKLSNANIIIPDLGEEVSMQKVDVNLDGVEWKPSLQAILDTHGLELYEKIPGTEVYSIREKPADAPEPQEAKVYRLNYASVSDVTNLVATFVGEEGTISAFPGRNILVVQATAKKLQELDPVILNIDLPREQVFIEAKFLELNESAQRDLGINWQVLEAYSVTASGLQLSRTETFTRSEDETRYRDLAGRSYEAIDDAATFDELDERDGNPAEYERIFGLTPTYEDTQTAVIDQTLTAVLSADDFGLVLSALEQNDGIEIVSNPKIIVANEQEALIHIGSKEPNIRITKTAGTDNNPGTQTSIALDPQMPYFEDGVKLTVTPTINTANNITVEIVPELATITGYKTVEENDYPIMQTKMVRTMFSLESGQTAAIGGLTRSEDSDVVKKVPLLGDLPLIHRFFKYEQTIRQQDETIIFVTVGLANPANIDMETGLPQRTELARRHNIRYATDEGVEREALTILQKREDERLESEINALNEAEQRRQQAGSGGFFSWFRNDIPQAPVEGE